MQLKRSIVLALITSISACSIVSHVNVETGQEEAISKPLMGEKVSHFMMTEDGKTLVVLGNNHHFSFPINDNVADILKWESRKRLTASFYDAESMDGVNIKIRYRLMAFKDRTPEEVSFLKAHNFSYNSNIGYYVLNGDLSGHYYSASDVDLSKFDKFKHEYRLIYKGEKIPVAKHKTSVTETGASLLFLGAALIIIPLVVITSPFTSDYKGAW